MSFFAQAHTWIFLAATALGVTIAFALDYTRRRRALESIGQPRQLERMMASLSRRRRVLKAILFTVALTLIVAALGRPRVEGEVRWAKRGIDLAIVMDYSKSMLARDVYPSRLERMTREVDTLLDELDSDRVAVVAYAGAAAHFPLTHDHLAARSVFRGLSPADLPPGSNLGEAILTARCALRPELLEEAGCEKVGGRGGGGAPLTEEAPAKTPLPGLEARQQRGRALVVFTDGEDSGGNARAEIERAVTQGIHVYLVGVGTRSGELIPERDELGNDIGWKKTDDGKSFVTTRLDEAGLRALAEAAGGAGHYLALDPKAAGATELLTALRRVKKGDLDERFISQPVEVYSWLLFPAFLLLVLEACISERKRSARLRAPLS